MTYTFIARAGSDLPVATCCRVMEVSTSGFYAWRAHPCSDRDWADATLTNTIVDLRRMSRCSYGSPRVHAELRLGLDTCCSRKRVERLMRQAGAAGIHHRRNRGCTRRDLAAEPRDDRSPSAGRSPTLRRLPTKAACPAVQGSGTQHLAVEALDGSADFVDFDDYWSPFLAGQGAAPSFVVTQPDQTRTALAAALRRRLPIHADGSIRVNIRVWAVRRYVSTKTT